MEIGVDCIEIQRFQELENDLKVLSNIFTRDEIEYCKNKKNVCQHYASRFAGKEAVIKAMSPYGVRLVPKQVEITNNLLGIPCVNLPDEYKERFNVKISFSHSETLALAFVIAEKKGDSFSEVK